MVVAIVMRLVKRHRLRYQSIVAFDECGRDLKRPRVVCRNVDFVSRFLPSGERNHAEVFARLNGGIHEQIERHRSEGDGAARATGNRKGSVEVPAFRQMQGGFERDFVRGPALGIKHDFVPHQYKKLGR